jgi:hypothetical protein
MTPVPFFPSPFFFVPFFLNAHAQHNAKYTKGIGRHLVFPCRFNPPKTLSPGNTFRSNSFDGSACKGVRHSADLLFLAAKECSVCTLLVSLLPYRLHFRGTNITSGLI